MSEKRTTPVDVLVAKRIGAHRRQRRLSQGEVAKQLGLTFQQIQKYEKGVNRISAGRLFEIARLFQVPIQALFPGSEDTSEHAENSSADMSAISDFHLTADGWRLCHAFLQIRDERLRKRIIAFVQALKEE